MSRAHRLHFASALARQHRSPSTFPCASSYLPSLLFVLQCSLSVSSSYNSKIPKPDGMSASLPTCDRTKHTKQQRFKSVSQPSHSLSLDLSLSGCISFNAVTHSRKQLEYRSDSREVYQTGALMWKRGNRKRGHFFYISLGGFSTYFFFLKALGKRDFRSQLRQTQITDVLVNLLHVNRLNSPRIRGWGLGKHILVSASCKGQKARCK